MIFNPNYLLLINRIGKYFDKGETFSWVNFELGIKAAEELKTVFGRTDNLAQYALRWILMFDAVSCVIPGASSPLQIEANVMVSSLPSLTDQQMKQVKEIYEKYIKKDIHNLW